MKKLWGKFILALADGLDFLIGGLIKVMEAVVDVISGLGRYILAIFGILACSGFVFLLPLLLIYLPIILILVFFFIVVPLLGKKFISYLEYVHYSAVEYLRNYADYLINNTGNYKSYKDFKESYRQKKEAEERARQEKQRAQNEFWEEIFRNFGQGYYRYDNTTGNYRTNTGGYSNQRQAYQNPLEDFNKKYRESCQILEVPEKTNVYEVKTAYRKLAKKYHPDLNDSPEATEMFQKVNAAYEFLTEENITRYNNYNK